MQKLLSGFAFLVIAVLAIAQEPSVFQRGDIVRAKSKSPAYALRVIAAPGDNVRMDKSGIYVNDVAVTGLSPDLIANNPGGDKIISTGHYFVVGEQRVASETGENLSQTYSFTSGGSLEKVAQ